METSINDLPQPGEKVWYIIKKDSHEGPFSFEELKERKSSGELDDQSPIWAKGWPDSLRFKNVFEAYERSVSRPREIIKIETIYEESQPIEEESPVDPIVEEEYKKRKWPIYVTAIFALAVALMAVTQLSPKAELVRLEDMNVAVFRELKKSYSLIQSSVPVPKASISGDYTKIWMMDRSGQDCFYEASFTSDANNNLSGEMISFKSQTLSAMHWIVFERFTFIEGQRILPGRYNLQLERKNCQAKGIESFWKK
ncbi:MAG: DUF4339 domain-containing protein, partial [Bacteriovoracaceae bacterium]|nr:DUF4339 domain-containing protein [Bacteriovoracaceae bacterium]